MASKVTSKLQVTIPKVIADEYRIDPGQEIEWLPAGDAIRVVPQRAPTAAPSSSEELRRRLELFDQATARQRARTPQPPSSVDPTRERGWTREELYERGSPG